MINDEQRKLLADNFPQVVKSLPYYTAEIKKHLISFYVETSKNGEDYIYLTFSDDEIHSEIANQVIKLAGSFRPGPGRFMGYVHTWLVPNVVKALNSRIKKMNRETPFSMIKLDGEEDTPEEYVERHMLGERKRRNPVYQIDREIDKKEFLDSLPLIDKAIMEMTEEGYSVRDIAQRTGLNKNTVSKHLLKLKEQAKEYLNS